MFRHPERKEGHGKTAPKMKYLSSFGIQKSISQSAL